MNWHTLMILAVFLAGMLANGLLVFAWCCWQIRKERREVLEMLKTPRYGP